MCDSLAPHACHVNLVSCAATTSRSGSSGVRCLLLSTHGLVLVTVICLLSAAAVIVRLLVFI
jgi:hypothetical protein